MTIIITTSCGLTIGVNLTAASLNPRPPLQSAKREGGVRVHGGGQEVRAGVRVHGRVKRCRFGEEGVKRCRGWRGGGQEVQGL